MMRIDAGSIEFDIQIDQIPISMCRISAMDSRIMFIFATFLFRLQLCVSPCNLVPPRIREKTK